MIADEEQATAWLRARDDCSVLAWERLERLAVLLVAENERQNLVSATTLASIWRRHIVDSAQLLDHVPRGTGTWLDLGTGAGFPGVVIAILRDAPMVLVEARARRAEWLARVSSVLDLSHVQVFGQQLTSVAPLTAEVISGRAFAPLDRLMALSAAFSTPETIWLLPKGTSARDELARLKGWHHTFHVEPSITQADAGIIVGRLLGQTGEKR